MNLYSVYSVFEFPLYICNFQAFAMIWIFLVLPLYGLSGIYKGQSSSYALSLDEDISLSSQPLGFKYLVLLNFDLHYLSSLISEDKQKDLQNKLIFQNVCDYRITTKKVVLLDFLCYVFCQWKMGFVKIFL